jgi:hypothetical protein
MRKYVNFISIEADEKDIIISFAVPDPLLDIKSLLIIRSFFCEEFIPIEEKGAIVSMEGEEFEDEFGNKLCNITISENEIDIKARFNEYYLDISGIEKERIDEMVNMLRKQNYDNRFTIQIV